VTKPPLAPGAVRVRLAALAIVALLVYQLVAVFHGVDTGFDRTKELPTAPTATSLVLVVDTSGSMDDKVAGGGSKLQYAKQVLTEDFLPLLSDDVHVALLRFADREVVELSPLRKNASMDAPQWTHREALMELVDKMRAGGQTPIVKAMRRAHAILESVPGRKILALVTDGEESFEGKTGVLAALETNRGSGIETFVVGFNVGLEGKYLQDQLGPGKHYFEANGGRDALLAAMQSILAAIEK
jgi:nitric oxide reductase activation protein